MTKQRQLALLRIVFGSLALVAIGTQLARHIHFGFNVINFFSYFTNLSNGLAAIVLIVGGVYGLRGTKLGRTYRLIRGTAVLAMAVVGIVFSLLLRNEDLGTLLPWVNLTLHYLMPVVVVGDWIISPPTSRLSNRQLGYWLLYPLAYLLYSLVRGAIVHWYAYPFLNPAKSGGYLGLSGYCFFILVLFVIFGWSLQRIANRRHMKR